MKLHKIIILNYRKFERLDVDFHPQMTVIIGNNGVGKTTVLDAAAIGIGSFFLGIEGAVSPGIKRDDIRHISKMSGSRVDRYPQLPVAIACDGELNGEAVSWARALKTETGNTTYGDSYYLKKSAAEMQERIRSGSDDDIILPVISYYGTGRLWAQKQESSKKNIDNRFHGYIDCLSAESNERLMLKWFEQMTYIQLQEGRKLPELEAVKKAINTAYQQSGANIKDSWVFFNVKTHQLEISGHNTYGEFFNHPFHELSAGYRNTLSLIADIAYRMAVLNPQFLENVTSMTPGIVLIDEVDLHLHPKWQKNILRTLREIFPRVQFIVTTHSPSIIFSANTDELLILEENSCKKFDCEVYGMDANTVLTDVMETTDTPDDVAVLFKEFDKLMDAENYEGAENTLDKLREKIDANDSRLISASVALDFRKGWDE